MRTRSLLHYFGFVILVAIILTGCDLSKPLYTNSSTETQDPGKMERLSTTPEPITPTELPTAEQLNPTSTTETDNNSLHEMVYIPGGTFSMGGEKSDVEWHLASCNQYDDCDIIDFEDIDPKHEVELTSFYIGIHEVTNAEYRMCVNEGACRKPDDKAIAKYLDSDYYSNSRYNDYPVVAITWNDAVTYCQWDGGKQLPSEAQWEFAAKGEGSWYFPWDAYPDGYTASRVFGGSTALTNYCDINCQMRWKDEQLNDGYPGPSPVMGFPPGVNGLYGMAGNVTEWIQDYYKENYYAISPVKDPINTSFSDWRVTRGGGWNNGIYYMTSIFRSAQDPAKSTAFLGFRCVK